MDTNTFTDLTNPDHDLLMLQSEREAMWENGIPIDEQDQIIHTMGELITQVSKIQHARMVNKGFYETFTITRNLLRDKVKESHGQYMECMKHPEQATTQELYWREYKKWLKVLREHTVNFILKQMCLIHEEAAEGSSAVREGNRNDDKLTDELGIAAEIADVFIRGFDLAGFMGIDLGKVITAKIGYNATRPRMHGKDA